jgi:hypothetical protein
MVAIIPTFVIMARTRKFTSAMMVEVRKSGGTFVPFVASELRESANEVIKDIEN